MKTIRDSELLKRRRRKAVLAIVEDASALLDHFEPDSMAEWVTKVVEVGEEGMLREVQAVIEPIVSRAAADPEALKGGPVTLTRLEFMELRKLLCLDV